MACRRVFLQQPTDPFILRPSPNECFFSRWRSVLETMRKSEELCDVKIITQNGSISAHRVILSAAIPLFRAMFRSSMEESQRNEVRVGKVDATVLELIINFVYGNAMEITIENVQSLLEASDFLQMDDLKEECCGFMCYNLNPENVWQVKSFAPTVNCSSLIEECHDYIKKNFCAFCHSKSFQSLPFSTVQDVISISGNAEEIFEAVISWVKAPNEEGDNRKDMLDTLLSNVQFNELSFDFLCESVVPEDLIQNCALFKEFIEEAKASLTSTLPPRKSSHDYYEELLSLSFYEPTERASKEFAENFRAYRKAMPRRPGRQYWGALFPDNYEALLFDDEFEESESQGLYAVCHSFSFGLYVRHYDAIKENWVTLGDSFLFQASVISAVTLLDYILSFGDSGFRLFDSKTRSWEDFQADASPFDYTFVLHHNKVYIFEKYQHMTQRCRLLGNTCNTIQSFTLPYGKCIPAGQMNRCSDGFSVVSLDDYIYVTGGSTDSVCVDIAERYHPESQLWTTIAPMLTAKKNHSSAALNGKIYVCGGSANAMEFLDSVEYYSNDSDQWTCVASMKMRRSSFSLTSAMGKLFLVDCTESCLKKYCFEIYDPDTDEWKDGPPVFVVDDVKETQVVLTANSEIGY